jgi:hypothetical protein
MADKKTYRHGGARVGAGRKKGVGKYFTLKKVVSDCFDEMFIKITEDKRLRSIVASELTQSELFETSGKVYVIKNLHNDLIKIGITSMKAKRRFNHYKTHTDIRLLYMVELDNYEEVEIDIHEKYEKYRQNGEWFKLSNSDVLNIISYLTTEKFKKEL